MHLNYFPGVIHHNSLR